MLNYSTNSNPEILKSSIAGSRLFKHLLFWLVALFLSANTYAGVSVNFNKVYKATGNSYNQNTQNTPITTPVSGTNFKFEQPSEPTAFNGNFVRGILTYTDASGQGVTIYGEINRRDKTGGPGDNTISFYFVEISNNDLVNPTYSGYAYVLIHPVNGTTVTDNSTITTSSDPIDNALNAMLNAQPRITSQMSTATQTVCLNAAVTPLQLTATISSGTFSEVKWYQNATNANAGGTLVRTVALTGTSQTITYTPTSSTTGDSYYYAIITGSSGLKTTSNVSGKITVLDPPTISGVTGTLSICSGLTTTLTAASATSSPTYKWYTAATGGTLLYTGASYTTAALTTTTSFYVDVTNAGGCASTPRTATTVTVNTSPTISGVTGTLSICSGLTTTLTAASATSSPTYKWYTAATGGTLLYTGASYTTAALTTTTSFYVDVTNDGGCTSAPRTATTVTVNAVPTISGVTGTLSICTGSTTTLTAASAASTPTYNWYTVGTGGTSIHTGAAYTTAALTTTTSFYVDVTSSGGCVSASRTQVTVTVNNKPAVSVTPTTATIQLGEAVILTGSGADSYSWLPVTGLSASNTVSVTANPTVTTTYTVTGTSNSSGCTNTATVTVTVASQLYPDINVTNVNVAVNGNVSTNDVIPSGSSYGTPVPASGNPSGATITMNTDGTYVFKATQPGTYTYQVPLCAPGQTSNCPTTSLVITVKDPLRSDNPPVANLDIVTALPGVTTTTNILANDKCSNAGCSLNTSSVMIVTAPLNGTAAVNADGTINYTPRTGFSGTDSLQYKVCDNGSPANCATAWVYYTVPAADAAPVTVAMDDYANTYPGVATSGDLLTNDKNTGGGTLSVTASGTVPASKGVLTINSDGSYTFTPTSTFSGPIDVVYTVCGGTPSTCAKATLHILVDPPAQLNPDVNATNVNVPASGNVSTNDVIPPGSSYGTPIPASGNPSGATITMNTNGTYVFNATQPGTYTYQVPLCASGQTSNCPSTSLVITVKDPARTDNPPVVNLDIVTALPGETTTTNVLANDKCSNIGCSLNTASVTIVTDPLNGTATVNADGTINYTPRAGFSGTDSLRYRVCDNGSPANCATAWVYYTVPVNPDPITIATDDYATTTVGTEVRGSLVNNDRNTGNASLTVTASGTVPASKGVLVINSDGTYTFTPAPGFTGPIEVAYTVCGGTPSTCAKATLYLLIEYPAVDPPKATGGTYNAGDPSNPVNIGKTVSAPPAGSKTIYCDVNGNNCSTTVPLLPTKPGIYVWCVKNIDTISNISSTPCVYDTIRILPTVTTVNATYVLGGIGLPTNISGLIKTITAGSKPQWCDVNGQNCTTTAPALPNKLGVFVWCVKAIDTASGLVSTPCKYDTVTIIAPQTIMEVTKRFESIKLQPDGSFLAVFKIKTTNLMNVKMDSVQVKDDLSKVFTSASDYSIVNVQATGTLVTNALYNGSGVIDLLTLQSSLAANKSDSITLSIKVNASAPAGTYNNVAIMQANTPYGRAQLASNDPVANASDPNNRLATKFQVPKLDIIIPGGFSPNQDGVDDKFIITRPYGTRIALQVFNRWGNQVYQNGDYRNDWDGRGSGNFMGQYVPEGTYYYVVVATDATGIVQKFAGPLTIVR